MKTKNKLDSFLEELLDDGVANKKTVVHYQNNTSDPSAEVFHDEDIPATIVDNEELEKIEEEYGYRHNYIPDSRVVSFYDKDGNETFETPSIEDDSINDGEFSLSEAYFGKKVVEQAFLYFSVVREKFKDAKYNPKMNMDPDVIKFNRSIEKTFGFSTFSLSISPDFSFNAYAVPIYVYLNPSDVQKIKSSLLGGSSGFRFSDYGKIVALSAINMGALESNLTNEELFAVLLHEIGHMFYEAVIDPIGKYHTASYISNILSRVNDRIYDIISNGTKDILNTDVMSDIDTITRPFMTKIALGVTNIRKFITLPFHGVFTLYKLAKNKLVHENMFSNMTDKSKIAYTNEKFADTFASMYGYGPELHSALLKSFKNYEENNVPKKYAQPKGFIGKAIVFADIMLHDYLLFAMNLKDEHPDGLTRINVAIQYLSKEIAKDNIDPKMKKELIDQVNNLKKQIEDYISFNGSEGDTLSVTRSYYIYLYKKFGGDRREAQSDNDALFKAIDDMLATLKSN